MNSDVGAAFLIDENKDLFNKESRDNLLHKINNMTFVKNFDNYDLINVKLIKECYESTNINNNNTIKNIIQTINH
uniref:Glycosyl transferase n=1 Tax=Strongyloides papillosus TaxID=174720 RepID=A0A0N5C610_STREA